MAGICFDVIYLDGLHTFEQTLCDLMNAATLISPIGVIIVDDVLPNSYDASLSELSQVFSLRSQAALLDDISWPSDGSWMGDVFKIPFFIQTFMQQYSYATVAENHGQTIMWRQARPADAIVQRSVEEVSRYDYRHTIALRSVYNLTTLDDITNKVSATIRSGKARV